MNTYVTIRSAADHTRLFPGKDDLLVLDFVPEQAGRHQLISPLDILGGKVVRLLRGEYDAVTSYGDTPVVVAKRWAVTGVSLIHVVDLDGHLLGLSGRAQVARDQIHRGQGTRCHASASICRKAWAERARWLCWFFTSAVSSSTSALSASTSTRCVGR